MSDVMLFGVLEMPYNMAMNDELSRWQYWQRGQESAQNIRDLQAQVEELQADAERLDWLDKEISGGEPKRIACLPGCLRAVIDAARKDQQ